MRRGTALGLIHYAIRLTAAERVRTLTLGNELQGIRAGWADASRREGAGAYGALTPSASRHLLHALKPPTRCRHVPYVQGAAAADGGKKGAAAAAAPAAAAAAPAAGDAPAAAAAEAGGKKEGGKKDKKEGKKEGGAAAPAAAAAAPAGKKDEEIGIDALDCRVGKIVKVGPHPNADALYLEEVRSGVAGS